MCVTGLLAISCAFAGCAFAGSEKPITDRNYRVFDGAGSPATLDQVVEAAQRANVTFLGEMHDDAVAHHLEAEILRRLAGLQWALSLEMFERDVQGVMDEYLNGLIDEKDLIASGRAWSNYRTDYKPLIEIAKQNRMPVIAANAPKRYVDIVARKGQTALLALSPEAKRTLPPLPYPAASQAYRERFEREMNQEMGKVKAAAKPGATPVPGHQTESDYALQAQSLWDAAMAYSIAEFLKQHPDRRVLEINGSFHSEGHLGIPERLEVYRPGTKTVVVTMIRDKSFPAWKEADMKSAGDFVIVTDPHVKPNRPKKP